MIHYHGGPITPRSVLQTLAGKHFCVSYAQDQDVAEVHRIGQSVMLDNGAFTQWKRNPMAPMYVWDGFWAWAEQWLESHTTWAVIPDVINGSERDNNELIDKAEGRLGHRRSQISPVWHIHEPIGRLKMLMHNFDRVCFGSSGEYAQLNSPKWNNRMNAVFNDICRGSGRPPVWIHMLRGMSLSGSVYPFASVDSTDIARNHNRPQNTALEMANRWDAMQCPARWVERPIQTMLEAVTQ